MSPIRRSVRLALALAAVFTALAPWPALNAQKLEPLVYTISFPQPASKTFDVKIQSPPASASRSK